MRGDTSKPATPIATAMLLAGLLTTTAMVPPGDAAGVREDVPVTAGRTIIPEQEAVRSSAAGKVLRHITQARGDVEVGDPGAANIQLSKALALLELIEASLPTSIAQNHLGIAKKHLAYEDAAAVLPDLVPIYSSLDDLTEYMPVKKARMHLDKAKKHLTKNDKNKAAKDLERASEYLVYTEVDLPLKTTRHLVTQAKDQLKNGDIQAAGTFLKAAEDNVVFLSVAIHDPLTEAHTSLWRAARDYTVGAYDAAKSEVERALRYLEFATNGADQKTRKAAKAISQQAHSLEKRIAAKSEEVPSLLDELWSRTKAFSERSVEYFTVDWQRRHANTDFKADLIEAKLHLTYAEIDRFTASSADQAMQELGQAQKYLDRALNRARPKDTKQIAAVRDNVEALAAEKSSDQKESQYAALLARLSKLIEAL